MPAKRLSTRRMMPQRCAHASDMIVLCAPESTIAVSRTPFTSSGTYSMTTLPKASGISSFASS